MKVYEKYLKQRLDELEQEYATQRKREIKAWRDFARTGQCHGIFCPGCPFKPGHSPLCDVQAEGRIKKLHEEAEE